MSVEEGICKDEGMLCPPAWRLLRIALRLSLSELARSVATIDDARVDSRDETEGFVEVAGEIN